MSVVQAKFAFQVLHRQPKLYGSTDLCKACSRLTDIVEDAKVKSTRKVSSRFIFEQSSLCKMNGYSLNTMMTFSYDSKGFFLLGNKTCDSHGNIKNVSTILFNMYHSPLVLCLSSCVFCWFRDELGTMQKVEIKPHQMAPGQTT